MSVSSEEIGAFVDGEADGEARARIAAAALADPAVRGRIDAERALREQLTAHFTPVMEEPVPEDWVVAIRAAEPDGARARRRGLVGLALAASLVAGVAIGLQIHTGVAVTGPVAVRGGALVASGELADALDGQLAATQPADAPVRMLNSFRRAGGDVCRVFSGEQASGIACREGDEWRLQHVLPGQPRERAAYRQAGDRDAALMALAQAMAAGAPMDAAGEAAARGRGWR